MKAVCTSHCVHRTKPQKGSRIFGTITYISYGKNSIFEIGHADPTANSSDKLPRLFVAFSAEASAPMPNFNDFHSQDATTTYAHYTTPLYVCRMRTYTRIECSAVHRRIAATADGRKSLGDCERFLAPDQGPEHIILLDTTPPPPRAPVHPSARGAQPGGSKMGKKFRKIGRFLV